MNRVIILVGQRVRSGSNFVASTLSMHPDIVTLPPEVSSGELNLFRDRSILDVCFQNISRSNFGIEFDSIDESRFFEYYGQMWIEFLKDKYQIEDNKTIFIKTYVIHNLDLWQKTFPYSQIAIIYRDGRDNVVSSVRASFDKRSWHNLFLTLKKKFNYYSGRSFINHTRHWAKTAQLLMKIEVSQNLRLFKFEDLNNSRSNIRSLLEYYQLNSSEAILNDCLNAPVVGSSFGIKTKDTIKPNWNPVTDKSDFQFSVKWNRWSFVKKSVFKLLAGKELVALQYEKNKFW
jgi:hypothetical protein